MRISSISIAQPVRMNYTKRTTNVQLQPKQTQQPAFKGWKAGLGSLIGTGAGIVLGTVLSGGLLAPLLLGAAGTTAGAIYGSSKEDHSSDDHIDYDPCYPNYRDC